MILLSISEVRPDWFQPKKHYQSIKRVVGCISWIPVDKILKSLKLFAWFNKRAPWGSVENSIRTFCANKKNKFLKSCPLHKYISLPFSWFELPLRLFWRASSIIFTDEHNERFYCQIVKPRTTTGISVARKPIRADFKVALSHGQFWQFALNDFSPCFWLLVSCSRSTE